MKLMTLKVLFAIAVYYNFNIDQIDIKTNFFLFIYQSTCLHTDIKMLIIICQQKYGL